MISRNATLRESKFSNSPSSSLHYTLIILVDTLMKARRGKNKSPASGNESAASAPSVEVSTPSIGNATTLIEVTLPPYVTDGAVPQAVNKTGHTVQ
jgi:hypothetical protein